jgi:hypothetical protein
MATGIAWVLNLDADLELGAGAAGARYDRTAAVGRAMKAPTERLARSLLGPDDVVVDDPCAPLVARGRIGRAFCPTARALAVLAKAGANPEPHPSVEVLRRVNSRAFSGGLGETLPGAAFVSALDAARATLGSRPPLGKAWRVKWAFGMAGRNQRLVPPSSADARDLAFVTNGLVQGGVQIEPDVPIEDEYAVHGFIGPDGSLAIGGTVRQRCDARGAWVATEPLASGPLAVAGTRETLAGECRRVAEALSAAGYFGPFGIDAYAYRDDQGELRLQPRSEINARYSMGFPRALVPR